jgi:predicted ATPase
MDDAEFTRSASEEALTLANGRGFHHQEMIATILLGWARACQGEVDEGVSDVERGLAFAETSGAVGGLPLYYVAAAHVYRMAKRREPAEELIDRATAIYERTGEKLFAPHALLARGRIRLELGEGDPLEVESLFLDAVESAGACGILNWALIISTHLARLAPRTGKLREAHDRLAGHYARLTEGFDRGPARAAKAALEELAALSNAAPTGA